MLLAFLPLAVLPADLISILAMVAILCLLWWAIKFLPEPVAQLRWLGYIIIILVMVYYIWTHWVH